MTRRVWVWAEHDKEKVAPVSLGLAGKAHELAGQMGGGEVAAVLLGGAQPLGQQLIDCGADRVYIIDADVSPFDTQLQAQYGADLIAQHQPEVLLCGATATGRDIAAAIAARLKTGLTAHCIDLYMQEIKGRQLLVSVVAGWGGNLSIKILCPEKRPQMATVKPGIFAPPAPAKRSGEVLMVKSPARSSRIDIIDVVEEQDRAASLEQAQRIVAGGWGMSSAGGFKPVQELADLLNAVVAGTRPAVDAGWLPVEKMIGQSGKTVAPQLLVTLGVSGAAQFSTGAMSAKFILAVDKNPGAPIFEMADMGLAADLKDVLPLLIAKLKQAKSAK